MRIRILIGICCMVSLIFIVGCAYRGSVITPTGKEYKVKQSKGGMISVKTKEGEEIEAASGIYRGKLRK